VRSRHRHPRCERPIMKILTDEVGAPYAHLSPLEVVRVRFWRLIAIFAEGRWLEANGWRRARDGWLLPDWHPHKRQADQTKSRHTRFDNVASDRPELRREPYTQSHAANSQRAHCDRGTVQRRNVARHKVPTFPTYVYQPYAAAVQVAAFLVTTTAFTFNTRQTHFLFVLASSLLLCVSFFISHKARRAWELDWAESRLMRETSNEDRAVHRPN
jgi:hypothetical protein